MQQAKATTVDREVASTIPGKIIERLQCGHYAVYDAKVSSNEAVGQTARGCARYCNMCKEPRLKAKKKEW